MLITNDDATIGDNFSITLAGPLYRGANLELKLRAAFDKLLLG